MLPVAFLTLTVSNLSLSRDAGVEDFERKVDLMAENEADSDGDDWLSNLYREYREVVAEEGDGGDDQFNDEDLESPALDTTINEATGRKCWTERKVVKKALFRPSNRKSNSSHGRDRLHLRRQPLRRPLQLALGRLRRLGGRQRRGKVEIRSGNGRKRHQTVDLGVLKPLFSSVSPSEFSARKFFARSFAASAAASTSRAWAGRSRAISGGGWRPSRNWVKRSNASAKRASARKGWRSPRPWPTKLLDCQTQVQFSVIMMLGNS